MFVILCLNYSEIHPKSLELIVVQENNQASKQAYTSVYIVIDWSIFKDRFTDNKRQHTLAIWAEEHNSIFLYYLNVLRIFAELTFFIIQGDKMVCEGFIMCDTG